MPNHAKARLASFLWDTDEARYYYEDSGEPVSRDAIVEISQSITDATEDIMARLAEAFYFGKISDAEFEEAAQRTLKHAYNAQLALGGGGWSQIGFADWGRNGAWLHREYRFLSRFVQDVKTGAIRSVEEAMARGRLYGGRSYAVFWAKDRQYAITRYRYERWLTAGDDRVCEDCQAFAEMGRVAINTFQTVPGAGDTRCLGNCRCTIEYQA